MAACEQRVYPPDVVKYVKDQLKRVPATRSIQTETEASDDHAHELPLSMQLTNEMKHNTSLRNALLIKLIIDSAKDKVAEVDVHRTHEVVRKYSGEIGSLCFVFGEYLEEIPMFAVVKEVGIDDHGLIEFHNDYFPYPLYRDQGYAFYHALGDRKAFGAILNPLSVFSMAWDGVQRLWRRNIGGNLKGEGLVQGGIIVFDKLGVPIAVYQEDTGKDLPVADLVNALQCIRKRLESGRGT